MPNLSLIKTDMSHKPPSIRVGADPVDPFLAIATDTCDGALDASISRAKAAQRMEREQAIAGAIEVEGENLLRQGVVDSLAAERVERALPTDLSEADRRDAAAVAVRLHDGRWQALSRYYAADAILVELRKFLHDGHGYATDSELRELADRLAGTAHTTRLMVWTGQIGVTPRDWTKVALGLLNLREERS